MPGTNITFSRSALPGTQWSGDISQLLDLFVGHLIGSLENGAFVGQVGGTEPVTNIGLWLNGTVWYAWSSGDGRYLPLPLVTGSLQGSTLYTTQLISGAKTGNVTLNLPDKNTGTLATLADLATPPATITSTGSPITVNWTNSGQLGRQYAIISAATTIAEAGTAVDGQIIDLWIQVDNVVAAAGAYALTWPNTWIVSLGTASLPTAATDATKREINHFRIYHLGAYTFVEFVKSFSVLVAAGNPGADTTPPTVTGINAGFNSTNVVVSWSEALRGGSLTIGSWAVKRNGVTNVVTGVSASGSNVTITVTTAYGSSTSGTVQYTGTDVKDLAGNPAAVFGPSAITVESRLGDI